jgi:hypothetical protein
LFLDQSQIINDDEDYLICIKDENQWNEKEDLQRYKMTANRKIGWSIKKNLKSSVPDESPYEGNRGLQEFHSEPRKSLDPNIIQIFGPISPH